MSRYDDLVHAIETEIPGFRIVKKQESRLQRAIHWALVVVTLGQMRDYLQSYQTTIRRTVYVTPDWDERDADERYCTMRHELVHLRQFRRWTLPGMAFAYLLVPLPMGLAWCRAKFERDAYAETIRSTAEVFGITRVQEPRFREHIVRQFVTANYGWMWPFRGSIERWYDAVLAELS